MTKPSAGQTEEHSYTLQQINSGVRSVLDQINLTGRASDKASLSQALKTLLECRRIEELLQARSTVQRVLERLNQTAGDNAGQDGEGEVLSPEAIAKHFADEFGTEPEHKPNDFSPENTPEEIPTEPETET